MTHLQLWKVLTMEARGECDEGQADPGQTAGASPSPALPDWANLGKLFNFLLLQFFLPAKYK